MLYSRRRLAVFAFLFTFSSVAAAGLAAPAVQASELTAAEIAAQAPAHAAPISLEEADEIVLVGIVEFGYQDPQGRYVVDILQGTEAYLELRVTTPDGRPVEGAMPNIVMNGTSRLLMNELTTTVDGVLMFSVIAGQMGLDTVTASLGDESVEFAINVISSQALGFPEPQKNLEGGVSWRELMSAKVDYNENGMIATFPPAIKEMAGKTVKISGFMMPLEPDVKQKHFLLTSNPPSCFFHVPGGAAGSIEVFAPKGVEVSWMPVVLEGRFEPQDTSEIGVVYRMRDARVVQP